MAQWLRALTALAKVLSSIPSTHRAAHTCLVLSSGVQMYMYAKYPNTYMNKPFLKVNRRRHMRNIINPEAFPMVIVVMEERGEAREEGEFQGETR